MFGKKTIHCAKIRLAKVKYLYSDRRQRLMRRGRFDTTLNPFQSKLEFNHSNRKLAVTTQDRQVDRGLTL